jgi:hypothetical protein
MIKISDISNKSIVFKIYPSDQIIVTFFLVTFHWTIDLCETGAIKVMSHTRNDRFIIWCTCFTKHQ